MLTLNFNLNQRTITQNAESILQLQQIVAKQGDVLPVRAFIIEDNAVLDLSVPGGLWELSVAVKATPHSGSFAAFTKHFAKSTAAPYHYFGLLDLRTAALAAAFGPEDTSLRALLEMQLVRKRDEGQDLEAYDLDGSVPLEWRGRYYKIGEYSGQPMFSSNPTTGFPLLQWSSFNGWSLSSLTSGEIRWYAGVAFRDPALGPEDVEEWLQLNGGTGTPLFTKTPADGDMTVITSLSVPFKVEKDLITGLENTPVLLDTPEDWLAARAIRFDMVQSLTAGQKTQAKENLGFGGIQEYETYINSTGQTTLQGVTIAPEITERYRIELFGSWETTPTPVMISDANGGLPGTGDSFVFSNLSQASQDSGHYITIDSGGSKLNADIPIGGSTTIEVDITGRAGKLGALSVLSTPMSAKYGVRVTRLG